MMGLYIDSFEAQVWKSEGRDRSVYTLMKHWLLCYTVVMRDVLYTLSGERETESTAHKL